MKLLAIITGITLLVIVGLHQCDKLSKDPFEMDIKLSKLEVSG